MRDRADTVICSPGDSSTAMDESPASSTIIAQDRFAQDRFAPRLGAEMVCAAAVAIVAILVFYFHLGVYGLWEPDEARYAEIAREMIVLHDFALPHLNYVPYVEKPPLLYWLTAASMRLFGVNEFAARFANAAAAGLGVGTVYFFARRVFDLRRAVFAAIILSTSALYATMAQVLTTDMLLTAMITAALFAFFLQWREAGGWCWVMYAAMALAALVKGPIGIALPAAIGAAFLILERDWRGAIRRFKVLPGICLVIALAGPWFVAISIRQPDFPAFYFVGEHFRRFFEARYSHAQPIYFYVPLIVGAALPWSLFAPFIRWGLVWRNPAGRFCLIAAATILCIFSLAAAKLVPYILPALPPIAVVLADGIAELTAGVRAADCRRLAIVGALLGIAAGGVLIVAIFAHRFASPNPQMVRPALELAAMVLLATGVVMFLAFLSRRVLLGLGTLAAGMIALQLVASYGRVLAEPARSYAALGRAVAQRAPAGRLICYPRYIQSLPFYTGRRVILVGPMTELAYGAAHSPDSSDYFFARPSDLMRLWHAPGPAVLVLDRGAMRSLAKSLGGFKVIAADSKKIVIRPDPTPPAARAGADR